MEALPLLFTRRSVRHFSQQPIADDQVETLLKAAMVAPSAMDERPWQFVAVRERGTLDVLGERMEHCELFKEAALAVVVCGEPAREKFPGLDFWVQDCSACMQNLHLAAHALGLGSVWVALHPLEDRVAVARELMEIPENIMPFAVLAAGTPAEHPSPEDRYDPARVHLERW